MIQRATPHFCQLPPHAACTGPGDCPTVGDACVGYAFEANTPVPLEGLAASNTARTFSIRESIDGVDRNGDGDTDDMVMTFRDRASGKTEVLGATAGCGGLAGTPEGRAVVRVNQFPFSFPAVSVEDDVLAFLESESGQSCDETGDADASDGVLRIFRLGVGETPIARARAVDGALRIDDAPVEVSSGRVYVRTSEAEMARQGIQRATEAFGGGDVTAGNPPLTRRNSVFGVSGDGRLVAFSSFAGNLLAPGLDTNFLRDVFVYDRATQITTRVSEPTGGGNANHISAPLLDYQDAMISADGRWVAFSSWANNLVVGVISQHPRLPARSADRHDRAGEPGVRRRRSRTATATIRRSPTTASGSPSGATRAISCRRAPTRTTAPISSSSIADRARPSACRCAPTRRRLRWRTFPKRR